MRFLVDFLHGQKTGLYLDQLENYVIVAEYARGRRVLDCFSNQGDLRWLAPSGARSR